MNYRLSNNSNRIIAITINHTECIITLYVEFTVKD